MFEDPTVEDILEDLNRNAGTRPLRQIRNLKAEAERHLAALQTQHPEHESVSYCGPMDPTNPLDRIHFFQQVVDICQVQISLRMRRRTRAEKEPARLLQDCAGIFFKHSDDFRAIRFCDKDYTLTSRQAQVVQFLNSAHRQGEIAISQDRILEELGTNNSRLRDTFKGCELWGTLILSGEKKGTRRLSCTGTPFTSECRQ